ncbi:alpha-L-rhamnosidase-related protein [Litchfieldia salsa]|uniref:Alpha-L-rhamnosidase n=1 Tax=Litchfieldia salsa TaxID=930152 RepID=A0A1H0PY90_9BACI|nr:family 78 glycoside hydrolase catalytic domain [Litchfieldia salsa]SDP10092.1 alpha-L-rhamnosidase [Litchfieldia salsa]
MHIQKVENRVINVYQPFIDKANDLLTPLLEEKVEPIGIVETKKDQDYIHGWKAEKVEAIQSLKNHALGKGDSVIVDFGEHLVGYLSMRIVPVGSPPDAPLHVKFTFGEMPVEVSEPFSEYNGWISSSWLQEEVLHVDVLPEELNLPRRYSFRYLKIDVLDTSPKYKVSFENMHCMTVTSADQTKVVTLLHKDEMMKKIDEVSIKTLQDCMQDVFEDGPKRDRRLWLGDLRLQALANYETFQNNDLVKRCLYLFAGVPDEKGRVSANLFMKPSIIADDTYLFDYSLFFATTLYDYYMVADDKETLEELWPIAYRQVELALERLDERNIVKDDPTWWSFIDWHEELNKQAPSQAILIYTLKRVIKLAEILQDNRTSFLEDKLVEIERATVEHLWSEEVGFFVSGDLNQRSWASQVWMVLAEVLDHESSKRLLNKLIEENPAIGMNTPYMNHHFVEALLLVGEKEQAISFLKHYWGGMINDGADTFWELYNPNNKEYSPYGSHLINSYCHAWSCTPTYLIRKYDL